MKKLIALLLTAAMILSMAACGGSGNTNTTAASTEKADRLAQIKAKGYIEVATEPYFAPFEFMDPSKEGDDKYLGSDIQLMKAIAEELGVELKIVPLDFTAVLAGITTAKYDMAISAIAYSLDRAENMNLSNVYQLSDDGYGFIVRAEDADKYKSVDDLKDAVVATQSGSVQEGIFNLNVKGKCKESKLFPQMTDAYLAVQEGRADVCICSLGSASLYAEANGNKLVVPDFQFDVDPNMNGTVVALPKEDTDSLMEIVNKVVDRVRDDGSFSAWETEAKEQAKALGIE